jgi:tRNA(adenine34) deaminase
MRSNLFTSGISIMELNKQDEHFMREALKEARKALELNEVPIGAVIVCNGIIIARAYNYTEHLIDVTAHAEMQAITASANYLGGKYLQECVIYVTVEPCVMCAGALFWSQIGRIVYGASDPKRGFSIIGSHLLHPRTKISKSVLKNECALIMKTFFEAKRKEIE